MNYDNQTVKNNHQRTYSYKAEIRSCVTSKIKEPFQTFQHQSNQISRPLQKQQLEDYYPQKHDKIIQVQPKPFKTQTASNDQSTLKWNKKYDQRQQIQKNRKKQNQLNDYGMQEAKNLTEARKKLQKEATKLRGLYQKNMRKDTKQSSTNKIKQLEEEIRQLKIKNLQIQKQLLHQQYLRKARQTNDSPNQISIGHKYAHSLLNKPKFKIKHYQHDDTDSSFSSFEQQ